MRTKFSRSLLLFMVALCSFVGLTSVSAQTNWGTQLYSGGRVANYSRVIKLANGNLLAAHAVEFADNNGAIRIYKSTNNGVSFSFVTSFTDGTTKQIGTPDLIESSPGTVLLAYNRWNDAAFEQGQDLKIVQSTNEGASWAAVTTIETGVWNWEPEFARSSDGKLQLYYSYTSTLEPNNGSMFDQVIVRRESSNNGTSWGARTTVLGTLDGNNYGMPRIAKCGSTYYMAVEYYDDGGAVVTVTSSDGKSWGTTMKWMETSSGWMFSTPEIVCQNGALFGLGKAYKDSVFPVNDGNNGIIILKSNNGGTSWVEVASPFQIGFNNEDSNWSPSLLPLSNTQMFMITGSNVNGGSTMTVRFGTGSITTP
jgi:hypothetical protein